MPARTVIPSVLLLASLLAASQPLVACPPSVFPERGLFEASREAELIVLTRLTEVNVNDVSLMVMNLTEMLERRIRRAGFNVNLPEVEPTAAIYLEVVETWKGDPRSRVTLLVDGWIFGDSKFTDKPEFVFFLKYDSGAWRAVAEPIRISVPSHAVDLREMIWMANAVDLTDSTGPKSRRVWEVEAAARPGTCLYVTGLVPFEEYATAYLADFARELVLYGASSYGFRRTLALLEPYPSKVVDDIMLETMVAIGDDA